MDIETIATGGTSGVGGVLIAYLILKSKLNDIVYKDTFEAVVAGIQKQLETQTGLITEQGKDIKELLKK